MDWTRQALLVTCVLMYAQAIDGAIIDKYACYNTVLDMQCAADEIIVLQSAHYGRNSTSVAKRCRTPYQRHCDLDVTFSLNRLCAGRQHCSLDVNTEQFTDPCGYEEFLRVKYHCLPESSIEQTCTAASSPPLLDHGYIASPNYPLKYYLSARCRWHVAVQRRQTVRFTLVDFELDVRKGGACADELTISAGERVYFNDCGALGRQTVDVPSDTATVRFETGASSLAQRGFIVYFEAIGPGCQELVSTDHVTFDHFMVGQELYVNATCREGYVIPRREGLAGRGGGSDVGEGEGVVTRKTLRCRGSFWDEVVTDCVGINSVVPPVGPMVTQPRPMAASTSAPSSSAVVVGIILGVLCTVLVVIILLVLFIYIHRRRRSRAADRLESDFIVKVNNLQDENTRNEASLRRALNEVTGAPCGDRRVNLKYRDRRCAADDEAGRKLLGMQRYYDYEAEERGEGEEEDACLACGGAVRTSCRGERVCRCIPSPRRASRRSQSCHRRSRSGCSGLMSPPSTPTERPLCRHLSLSAPDLLRLGDDDRPGDCNACCHRSSPASAGPPPGTLNYSRKARHANKSQPNVRTRLF